MKYIFHLFAVLQLVVAESGNHFFVPLTVDNTTTNSCGSPSEKRKTALQGLRNSTIMAKILKTCTLPQCHRGDGFWYQIISIDMSITDSRCPDGWVEENEGVRACGRGNVNSGCRSAFLNVSGYQMEYTKVCGRAIGYQYRSPDAFRQSTTDTLTLDRNYVDGLSITYGFPRQHLWTFAAGVSEGNPSTSLSNCPCGDVQGQSATSFLGDNWYCESGNTHSYTPKKFGVILNDPLWDGENCEGTCCSNGKSPPWFSVELPGPTNDVIEARICGNEHSDDNEDTFINIFEIYIQ